MTNILDKYYTNKDVAQACIDVMLKYTKDCDYFIEPSAGDGAFIREFTTHAYDIAPENLCITQQDWLEVRTNSLSRVCVYGNPPYGKRNSLSKAFIKKSCEFADVIAFVLPAVYNKYTLQKVFPKEWRLVEVLNIPANSFTEYGKPYNIPSVFQVWCRYSNLPCIRDVARSVLSNKHFSLVDKSDGELYVMGAAPHNVKYPDSVSENNRGYWIKCFIPKEDIISNFKTTKWEGNSCANGGVAWYTKSEIMNNYERTHNGSK